MHSKVGRFTISNAGSFRLSADISIGGTDWIPPLPNEDEVDQNVQEKLKIDNPVERSLEMTAYLMSTQAFYDGNKRLSMLIGNKIMIENGLGIISVSQKEITSFYEHLIKFYETGEYEDIKEYLYNGCMDGMDIVKDNSILEL